MQYRVIYKDGSSQIIDATTYALDGSFSIFRDDDNDIVSRVLLGEARSSPVHLRHRYRVIPFHNKPPSVSDGSSPGCSTTPMASSRMLDACIRCSRIHTAAS